MIQTMKKHTSINEKIVFGVPNPFMANLSFWSMLVKEDPRLKVAGQNQKFSISERITDLTGALNQALKKENYEEAAALRDQIQNLMSEPDGS